MFAKGHTYKSAGLQKCRFAKTHAAVQTQSAYQPPGNGTFSLGHFHPLTMRVMSSATLDLVEILTFRLSKISFTCREGKA